MGIVVDYRAKAMYDDVQKAIHGAEPLDPSRWGTSFHRVIRLGDSKLNMLSAVCAGRMFVTSDLGYGDRVLQWEHIKTKCKGRKFELIYLPNTSVGVLIWKDGNDYLLGYINSQMWYWAEVFTKGEFPKSVLQFI